MRHTFPMVQRWRYPTVLRVKTVVRDVIGELDRVSAGFSGEEAAAVRRHFRTTSRYEWMFWQMGYAMESWPV